PASRRREARARGVRAAARGLALVTAPTGARAAGVRAPRRRARALRPGEPVLDARRSRAARAPRRVARLARSRRRDVALPRLPRAHPHPPLLPRRPAHG